jgi:hypothetical protein
MSSIPYKYNPLVYCCSQKAAENYRVFQTIIKYYKSRMRKFSSMKFIQTPLFNLRTYCFIIRYILFAIYFFPLISVAYRSVTKLLNILNMCADIFDENICIVDSMHMMRFTGEYTVLILYSCYRLDMYI